ncbi:MAG: sigma-70 family RNA polymerase sigma factor [Planctomycetota bacterium]
MILAQRAQKGDEQALNELFRRYQEPLRRIVRIRMGAHLRRQGGLESMDIVQQTLAKAYTKFEHVEIRTPQAILAWLAKIAERQVRDANDHMSASKRDYRRTGALQFSEDSLDSVFDMEPEANGSLPDESAEREELRRVVDDAMLELRDDYREIILLRDYAQADWQTIADEVDAPNVRAAQATYRRAKSKLGTLLEPWLDRLGY